MFTLSIAGNDDAPIGAVRRPASEMCRGAALGMDRIGIADRCRDLGGDSLGAAGIFAVVDQNFLIDIPMATPVDTSTIEQSTKRVDTLVWGQ